LGPLTCGIYQKSNIRNYILVLAMDVLTAEDILNLEEKIKGL